MDYAPPLDIDTDVKRSVGSVTSIEPENIVSWGSGDPLLLTHGAMGGVATNFAELAGYLSDRYELAGVNYPGSEGEPEALDPLSLNQLADRAVQAASTRGWSRFAVLGMSLGSAVAVTIAERHPHRVSALVLTVGFLRPDPQLRAFADSVEALIAAGSPNVAAELILAASTAPVDLWSMPEPRWSAIVAQIEAGLTPATFAQLTLARESDISDAAAALSVPTLVVTAGQDRIVLPENSRSLAVAIPSADCIEYPEAGHVLSAQEIMRLANDVSEFLRRHRS